MKKNLLGSSAGRFIEAIINISVSMLLTPFMLSALGVEQYGIWILLLAIVGWFSVFTLGLPVGVQREITIGIEKKNPDHVNEVFSSSLVLFLGLGAIGALLTVLLGRNAWVFGMDDSSLLAALFAMLSFKVIMDFFMLSFYGFFAGMLRYDIDALISAFCNIVKAVLIVWLAPTYKITGVMYALLASDLLMRILQIIGVIRLYPGIRFKRSFVKLNVLMDLFGYSKHVFVMSIAKIIYTKSDPIIVSNLFNLAAVSLYSIPARLCAHVNSMATSVLFVTQPVFNKLYAQKQDMQQMLGLITGINIFISCLIYLPLIALADPFIHLWVGDEFKDSVVIVDILVFSFLCQGVSKPIQDVLLAQARHKLIARVTFFGAFVNVGIAVFLGLKIGLIGIAFGVAIGFFISDIVLHLLVLKKQTEYAIWPLIRNFTVGVVFLYGAAFCFQLVIVHLALDTWLKFFSAAIVTAFCSLVLCWPLLIPRKVQEIVLREGRRIWAAKFKARG